MNLFFLSFFLSVFLSISFTYLSEHVVEKLELREKNGAPDLSMAAIWIPTECLKWGTELMHPTVHFAYFIAVRGYRDERS